ncbi:MAG: DUF1330 domain-containing protein [Pseudomonadota bacterium]|jgi:uncharacterized protein (DUF1330 family)|uniref:DUF1330 domain-containing protein n=1 Tax=Thalassovita sp. TaxID=1979401 RepID=UPI002AB05A48|nr:DUF1330 domain-containing protein [Thalassovita sp.]MEC7963778.1 DUF1330 domain-containing protein [Pseudomonadota bacterium]MEC8292482.1 DUF1330 domain-containing protein [Pseudomonadota bacterium]
MFKKLITAAALSTSLMTGAALADPVYLVATVSVTDWDKYMSDYASIAIPAIVGAGGEVLVGAQEVSVVEGSYDHNWTVVVKFPSADAANGFYGSPEYQAVIPARHAATNTDTSVLMVAPQFTPPS